MVPVAISTNEVKCFWPRPPVPEGLVPGNAGGDRSLPGQRAPGGWREEASFLAHCRSQRLSSAEPEVVLHGNRVRSHNRVLSGGATNCSWHFSSCSSLSALSAAGAFL